MLSNFSDTEKSMVKNMMLQKSHSYMASLLERPITAISSLVDILANGAITMQMKLDVKNAGKLKKTRSSSNLIDKQRKELHQKLVDRAEKNKAEAQLVANRLHLKRKYKTNCVDYSKMVTVKIDAKTFIYAKPGEEEIERKRFLKNYSKSL